MASYFPETTMGTSNCGVAVAQLSVISLARLHSNDPAELALLEKAASKTGFFYLDLRGDAEGERVLAHLPHVYTVAEKYFTQSEDAKIKDVRDEIKASQGLGWKKGNGMESFEMSRDEMALICASILNVPQTFRDEWKKIAGFSSGCDEACLTLLSSLSADFVVHHRANQASDTGLKLVLHPSSARLSDVAESLHTDSGTVTLLFFKDWSLHGFLPDANNWAFIRPVEGCALINVANALQRFSEGKLHSPKHRVTQPFDGAKNRYFLSYFLRPDNQLMDKWGPVSDPSV